MGSVHAADPHGSRGLDRIRGLGGRPVDVGDPRRVDWYRQARSHRLAHRLAPQPSRSTPGGSRNQADLRPAMVIKDKSGKVAKIARGGEARYQLAVDAIISVDPGTH